VGHRSEIHDRVLNAANLQELMAAYGDWAEKYDHDLLREMGYVAPRIAVSLLKEHLAHEGARVLDAGCGTGIVGELLHQKGYGHIEGLDCSPPMLEKAGAKGIYKALNRGDLNKNLDIAANTYDAVISVGTFTCGHVGPEAFEELVRITRPGGWVCFTVREQAWEEDNYRHRIEDMERRGLWERQELTAAGYIRQEGARCKVGLYRVPA
jgi:predicted TPR repeat methyltransferase